MHETLYHIRLNVSTVGSLLQGDMEQTEDMGRPSEASSA